MSANTTLPSQANTTRSLADEMDRRQKEWQRDVERMQQDFFKAVKLDQSAVDERSTRCQDSIAAGDVRLGDGVLRLPDGTAIFRAKFDLRDFEPHEINVRLIDDDDDDCGTRCRLIVRAQHVEVETRPNEGHQRAATQQHADGGQRRSNREFNRRVDLPPAVDRDRLVSRLGFDGLLTVEAPLLSPEVVAMMTAPPPPSYEAVAAAASSGGRRSSSGNRSLLMTSALGRPTTERQAGESSSKNAEIIEIDGCRLLKLVLDFATTDFAPEDVRVFVSDRKLAVVARREVTSPTTGKTARRQFSRELDLNETIVADGVEAALDRDSGRLLIVAAIAEERSRRNRGEEWSGGVPRSAAEVVNRTMRSIGAFRTAGRCAVQIR